MPFAELLDRGQQPGAFRFVVIGDTGEGDRSQYALVPLLRAVAPDFMIINGDVAYPAGEPGDFTAGFFQPYAGMGIPIWATAGNHEYYSLHNGRDFYEVFCTRTCSKEWSDAGLRLVPQPGMYWELRDPSGDTPLVVIGLDSGKKANLDGHKGFFSKINPFGHAQPPDRRQHEWLDWRLTLADARGDAAMVLFHIPGLVSGKDEEVHLAELHRILVRHPSVRLVLCGHIHNHQEYAPETFRSFVARVYGAPPSTHPAPVYIVSGNGGATIDGTTKIDPRTAGKLDYPLVDVFPSAADWTEYVSPAHQMLDKVASRSVITRAIGAFSDGAKHDTDPVGLQSFLLVEVEPQQRPRMKLIALKALDALFTGRPAEEELDIATCAALLDQGWLDVCCTRKTLEL
jgi:3',5'-cyclic AMP phosphodiesterase CpdA